MKFSYIAFFLFSSILIFSCKKGLQKITTKTACVIVETVQGEWGVRPPEKGYLKKLRQRCDEVGALLVLDEIQAGYGRTGRLWAFEQFGIVPDILTLGKALGGGLPMGAFISSKENMEKRPRRLTPQECARLMGFDKSGESKFIIPVSDTQSYKQFGNSVVVPVFEAVAKIMKPRLMEIKAAKESSEKAA